MGVSDHRENDDPIAATDTLTVTEDATATAVRRLANDTDVEGDTRTITGDADGAKGVGRHHRWRHGPDLQPTLNANGSDTFTYTIGAATAGGDGMST